MAIQDITTGNPTRLILWFALPLFIGNLFQQFYNIVDTLIVGRTLGVKALAAVGATGPVAFLVLGFVVGITAGFAVITAQRFGAQDDNGVRKSFTHTIMLCIILTLFLTLISTTTTKSLLLAMNTPSDIINQAYDYIYIIYLGLGTIIFYNAVSNVIRALGDSKTPLIFLIIASVMNIVLDLIFIINLKMGVSGAAWATTISQGVSAILCFMFMFIKFPILRLKKEDWKFDPKFAWEHIRIGFPMGFQMSVLTIGIIALQIVLNSFGAETIAAFTAATKVEQVAVQTFLALGVAIATYTAQNYGAGKIIRIRIGAHKGMIINIILTIITAILIYTCGKQLVGLFITGYEPELIRKAQIYLNIIIVFYFALATLILYRNILQGMGNAKIPLISGTLELIMRSAAAFIFGHYFGYLGVCFATPCAWVAAAIWLSIGYHRTVKKAVLRSERHSRPLSFIALDE